MPCTCPHPIRKWVSNSSRHMFTLARHPPTTGTFTYRLEGETQAPPTATPASSAGTIVGSPKGVAQVDTNACDLETSAGVTGVVPFVPAPVALPTPAYSRRPLPKAPPRRITPKPDRLTVGSATTNTKQKVLLLCGGPDTRITSITNLMATSGVTCMNFDTANGPTGDLSDGIIVDQVGRDARLGEYQACGASPECGTFSRLHNLPGPPPLRGAHGFRQIRT